MSELKQAVEDYLALRRALGFKLRDEGRCLPQFAAYVQQRGGDYITADLALQWATEPSGVQPAHWARRLSMVRLFAEYRRGTDPRTELPTATLLPYRYRRRSPYIYRQEEIDRLLQAAAQLPSRTGMRAVTYSVFFGLLAVTGMRVCEPIALDRTDVDLQHGLLTVRNSKFGKSRLVALHRSTENELRQYARHRNRLFPDTQNFFVSERGTRLTYWSVRWTFVKLSRQTGLRGQQDSHGPRLHDFRHTFAVRTLLSWYRDGQDVEARMPRLAAYLGHRHVHDTYWYISAVPELLQLAATRLDVVPGGLFA
jgi:integrase